jgi:hypothetical protein
VVAVNTEQLIELLSNDRLLRRRLGTTFLVAAAAGIFLAGVLFFTEIGVRADIAEAVHSIRFQFKFVVTMSLAAAAIVAMMKIARPDGNLRSKGGALLLAPALLACAAAIELVVVPSGQWMSHIVGHNSRSCLTLIPLISIGPLACLLIALREGAPSNPGLAGAMAGLAASGIAATFYAANCNDDSPLFVATWYPIAVLAVGLAGYLIGKPLLKW